MSLFIEYRHLQPDAPLPPDTLAVMGFGRDTLLPEDPRVVRVALEPLQTPLHIPNLVELWRTGDPVQTREQHGVRLASSRDYTFGVIELDEQAYPNIRAATADAYATLGALQAGAEHSHILRLWNHLDAINQGTGDAERYRQFCLGRAVNLERTLGSHRYPAATAVGRPLAYADKARKLQICWLASRWPGEALENPRQVSAFHYPREYGPQAPTFSRAMLLRETPLLMISGTASIVGHTSLHPGNLQSQCAETLANLRALIRSASEITAAGLKPDLGANSLLKVYLREPDSAMTVAEWLRTEIDPATACLILQADICRQDLLVEIDCVHGACAAVLVRETTGVWHNSNDKYPNTRIIGNPLG